MSFTRLSIPKSAYLDGILLGLLILLLNRFLDPKDFGWVKLNPSPYFLIPLLMGGRYGFLPGIISGALMAGIILAEHSYFRAPSSLPGPISPYFYFSLVLLGGLAGEIQHYFSKRLLQSELLKENLRNRMKKLEADYYLLRESRSEMEQMVATRDADVFTIDTEIRQLYAGDPQEIYREILRLLARQIRITEAAIYTLAGKEALERRASIGDSKAFPEQMRAAEVEMVSLALERKTAVTLPEFWERDPAGHRDYLLTVPFLDFHDKVFALLIVRAMPFIALNQKTVYLINSICKLVSGVLDLKMNSEGRYRLVGSGEQQKLFTRQFLKHNVETAFSSYQTHQLPSTIVFFFMPDQPKSLQPEFEELLLEVVRAGDFPAEMELGYPNLAVLLPLTGERGTGIFLERLLQHSRKHPVFRDLQHKIFTFEEMADFDALWSRLTEECVAKI